MGRRGANKLTGTGNGAMDRTVPGSPSSRMPAKFPIQPRPGNRLVLAVSGVCFLVWLAALAWLAFF